MFGNYDHNVDSKGRLVLPSKFREDLGASFYITIGINKSLYVMTSEAFLELKRKFEASPLDSELEMKTLFCGNATLCEPGEQGRVLIPPSLRKFANIDKEVTIVGVDDHAEIWNRQAWQDYNDSFTDAQMKSALRMASRQGG